MHYTKGKMENLFNKSIKKIEGIQFPFKRFLYDKINWDRRLIGLKGARGTGKTTILLQYIKENYGRSEEVLYVSLDDIYFAENKLIGLAAEFTKIGGRYLFIDEVHKYHNWSRELKNIYDDYPELKVVFTSSSILEIDKGEADLSRRAVVYELPVMSLREYISIEEGLVLPSYSIDEILTNHREISIELLKKFKAIKQLKNYYKVGVYPFYQETKFEYFQHLERIINLILENDLPAVVSIDFNAIIKLKQLLLIISENVPFTPNISKLSSRVGVTRDTIIKYLFYLERAQLISMLRSHKKGFAKMAKPEKIYLNNSNLMYALQPILINTGTLRETFFQNQLSVNHQISLPDKGDFIIDNKYVFEVGGKNKTYHQIANLKDSFIVSDDIEFGFKNKIPLWLFGFLY